jgi:hypothetical protein
LFVRTPEKLVHPPDPQQEIVSVNNGGRKRTSQQKLKGTTKQLLQRYQIKKV